ncbi:hypothetical protein L6258_00635 [Candidatus Parcubacteria bacterium]|nr:hypothetical protein [Candidatus Parcubacteria bacterium]
MKRLVLIDGNALIHRAYHAIPKTFTNSRGEPTNAVYGFASMFLKVITSLKPDYLAVAFDMKGPTFRHEEYEGYKEGRPEMEEALVSQLPKVRRLAQGFDVPTFEAPGFEGEDVIASLNRQAGEQHPELETVIVTGDMDLLQLVDKDTRIYAPKKGLSQPILYDEGKVQEKYGLKPEQVVDFKALRGDPSDRIPGVLGIGEKGAGELLRTFGTLEEVYRNLSKIRPAVAEKLGAGKESAFLSQKLARIVDTAPVELDLEKCRFREVDKVAAAGVLKDFGFRSLAKRILGEAAVETKKEVVNKDQMSLSL